MTTSNKLIVALDVETVSRARELIDILREHAGMFKVGSQLFTAAGPDLVREIIRSGSRVFLDLKFHDIPNTVAAAGVGSNSVGRHDFQCSRRGGSDMMRRTAEAVSRAAEIEGLSRPAVIAVTLLTSADSTTLEAIGLPSDPQSQVLRLALLAAQSGMDGVVASPLEVPAIRAALKQSGFLIVTPGVRPGGASRDDQKRVLNPAQAIRAGADYLVVGRPITTAKDPAEAARRIVEEMEPVVQ